MFDSIEKRIKNVMAAVLEIPIEQINDESSSDTVESWDSLKHMNLVVALEEEFDFSLDEQQIFDMANFKNIKKIVSQLIRKSN